MHLEVTWSVHQFQRPEAEVLECNLAWKHQQISLLCFKSHALWCCYESKCAFQWANWSAQKRSINAFFTAHASCSNTTEAGANVCNSTTRAVFTALSVLKAWLKNHRTSLWICTVLIQATHSDSLFVSEYMLSSSVIFSLCALCCLLWVTLAKHLSLVDMCEHEAWNFIQMHRQPLLPES